MIGHDYITLKEAESLTGLPSDMVVTLAERRRIPSQTTNEGEILVARKALLGWCKVYLRILFLVLEQESSYEPIYPGVSPFELVWLAQRSHESIGA